MKLWSFGSSCFSFLCEFSLTMNWWRSQATLRILFLLLLGQLVSFVLALCSFTSSLVANLGNHFTKTLLSFLFFGVIVIFYNVLVGYSLGVDAPITQSIFNYFALALVYGSILIYKRQKIQVLSFPPPFIFLQSALHKSNGMKSVLMISCGFWEFDLLYMEVCSFLGTGISS